MPRRALTLLTLAAALAGAGLPPAAPSPPAHAAEAAAPHESLEDLLMDLQVIPMDNVRLRPLTLETLDGRRVALAETKGPALLYFWATW
jgi:hypothetical protein